MPFLVLGMGSCAQKDKQDAKKEVYVFAAASMTETLNEIEKKYEAAHTDIDLKMSYESSGTLQKQIENGATCDLFISAAQKQMNALQEKDFVDTDTRLNLLENKVTLVVPSGNPKSVTSFEVLKGKLEAKEEGFILAIGNSDVPVGQYTQKIFTHYGLVESELATAGLLSYGTNVKEVTTQVSQASAHAGIIYKTDAFSAKLTVVDEATAEMCGQVIYPAAALKNAPQKEAAKEFLEYLKTKEASDVFESVGFTALNK